MDYLASMNEAIGFMERNLLEPISYQDVAEHLYMSSYHFHRTFTMLTGMTANDYLKKRRLSLAGHELVSTESRVLDIALKYGYESPEGFTKAFIRFHGVSPTKAKLTGRELKSFNRLVIKVKVEGGKEMDYRIVEREGFQLLAKVESFHVKEAGNQESTAIAEFWDESHKNGTCTFLEKQNELSDFYGVCAPVSKESQYFDYGIATIYSGGEVPDGYRIWEVKPTRWAVFSCIGSDPSCIGPTWDRIFKEFLPGSPYKMLDETDFELYPAEQKDDLFCEIWIPITNN